MSFIKLWKALRQGRVRSFREILGDRALMAATLFSVLLHACLFLFPADWPKAKARRAPAVMVARLLKPSAEPPALRSEEITGEGRITDVEEVEEAAEPMPAAETISPPEIDEEDAAPSGYGGGSASLTAKEGAGPAAAGGVLRLEERMVARARPGSPRAFEAPGRGAAVTTALPVPSAAGEEADFSEALLEIRRRIESKKAYPLAARRRGWEGEVLVELELGGAGELEGLRLLRQSGFPLLDRATLTAVRAAVPFPPVPGRVKIPVSYRLAPD